MLGPETGAMANRLPDQTIHVETFERKPVPAWRKLPLIRGVFGMFGQLGQSLQYTMKSADLQEEPADLPEEDKGDKAADAGSILVIALGLVLGVALFMLLPNAIVSLITRGRDLSGASYGETIGLNLIEGLIRVTLLLGYMTVISLQKDIHRTFQYHGAEHKTIMCYEAGSELTVDNVRACSRFHPRCGTSFLFIAVIIATLIYALTGWHQIWLNVLIRLVMLPLIMGLSYEVLRFSGKHAGTWYGRLLATPGLWLQRLTTREPDDSMLEVCIAAILPVIPADPLADQWGQA